MNKPIFALARALVPVGVALAVAPPRAATWALASAALLSYGVPRGLRLALNAQREKRPLPVGPLVVSLGLAAATVALGAIGLSQETTAAYYPVPAVLIGLLSLGVACLVPPSASVLPGLREIYLHPSRFVRQRSETELASMTPGEAKRRRLEDEQNTVLAAAVTSYVVHIVVEASSALYVSMAFVMVALTTSTDERWVWQAGGGFLLALGAASATAARSSQGEQGLVTTIGGVLLVAFVGLAIAFVQGATTTALAGPMVLISMILAVVGPARFPRLCDVVLGAAAIGTGVLIAVV